jgi:hypothetical protein
MSYGRKLVLRQHDDSIVGRQRASFDLCKPAKRFCKLSICNFKASHAHLQLADLLVAIGKVGFQMTDTIQEWLRCLLVAAHEGETHCEEHKQRQYLD